ncbi:MAG: nucleoside 2-deoxyribosyltransferase [Phycisphaerales bacterium]
MEEPRTKEVFVLMPFREEFDDVYEMLRSACAECSSGQSVRCRRADEIAEPGRITDQIIRCIRDADVVIADLTGSNPNVMYELGYAHALNKPSIILNQTVKDSPFDVKDMRQIVYDRGRLNKDCRPRVVPAIQSCLGQPSASASSGATTTGSATRKQLLSVSPSQPLVVNDALIGKLQMAYLKVRKAAETSDQTEMTTIAKEVLSTLDRVTPTVAAEADETDIRNVAAVIGNMGVVLESESLISLAEDVFRRGITLDPTFGGIHYQYADFLADRKRFEESKHMLQEAKRLDPSDVQHAKVIEIKLALKDKSVTTDISKFIQEAEREFGENPGDGARARSLLTLLCESSAPIDAIEKTCKEWMLASKEESTKYEARRILADYVAVSGDSAAAIPLLEDALGHTPREDRIAVLHNLATCLRNTKRHDEATKRWTEAYNLDRNNPVVRAAFSQHLSLRKDMDLAIKVASGEPLT